MATVPMEGATLPPLLTGIEVEDRLVEAMITCWRQPDRERAWLRQRSHWPEVLREAAAGDYDARGGVQDAGDVVLKPASITRREQGEMEEAFGWVDALAPADRMLVALVVVELARGRRDVDWANVMRKLGPVQDADGRLVVRRGKDGVRKRYRRLLDTLAARAKPQKSTGEAGQ